MIKICSTTRAVEIGETNPAIKLQKSTWNPILKPIKVQSALIDDQVKLQHDLTKECKLRTELECKVARLEENASVQER